MYKIRERTSRFLDVLLFTVLIIFFSVPVHAGSYQPLTVQVPVKGEGTYVMAPQDGAPDPARREIAADGEASFEVTFTEPGTYTYKCYDQSAASDMRTVTVYVTNDESQKALRLKDTVIVTKNDNKTDLDFRKPKENKHTKSDATPESSSSTTGSKKVKTGDGTEYWAYILMIITAILFIVVLEKKKHEGRREEK